MILNNFSARCTRGYQIYWANWNILRAHYARINVKPEGGEAGQKGGIWPLTFARVSGFWQQQQPEGREFWHALLFAGAMIGAAETGDYIGICIAHATLFSWFGK